MDRTDGVDRLDGADPADADRMAVAHTSVARTGADRSDVRRRAGDRAGDRAGPDPDLGGRAVAT